MSELLLSFHGIPLNNEQEIEEFDLVPGATIDASVKVLGGKTHGRIGNAGKVKGQTPKVNAFFIIHQNL
jgi:ribosomal protein S30